VRGAEKDRRVLLGLRGDANREFTAGGGGPLR
jgi:hypothetical protein